MTPTTVLDKIRSAGGTVRLEGDSLRVKVPPGFLNDQDRLLLAEHKSEVLRLLAESDPWDVCLGDNEWWVPNHSRATPQGLAVSFLGTRNKRSDSSWHASPVT